MTDETAFTADRLPRWCDEGSSALIALAASTENRFGYPPAGDVVRRAGAQDHSAADELARVPITAPCVAAFYRAVAEVTAPDVGNGCFIHPANDVLRLYREDGAVFIPAADGRQGMVLGSDGGGILFAADRGGAIYRSRAASVQSGFDKVAEGFPEFLELVRRSIIGFAATGEVGFL